MTITSTGTPPQAPAKGELSQRQRSAIIGGLLIASLLSALDQTVAVTAMRTIADDLHGLQLQAWVTTAYLITSTVTMPLYGKLGDLYGRRRVILTAMSIFVAGSALCGFANSMYELAGARAIQGLGAGGLISIVVAIVGDIVPPREQARYQSYFIPVYILASLIGPLVGGFFASTTTLLGISGWRWAFLVNLPVGLFALAVVARVLRLPHTPRRHRVDWAGAVALTVATVPVLIVLAHGRDWGWGSGPVLGLGAAGLLGLIAFGLIERRMGTDALLPPVFLRNRSFSVGIAVCLLVGAAMLGVLVTLPLYLQIVKSGSPTGAGLMLLALSAAMMLGSWLSGRYISRTGRYKILPVAGSLLLCAGLLLFLTIGTDTPRWQTALDMVVFGFGLGCCTQPLTIGVQNSLPPQALGVATASVGFSRQIGGMIGTATLLSVLFATVSARIDDAFAAARSSPDFVAALHDPAVLAGQANQVVVRAVAGGSVRDIPLDDSSFIATLDPRLARPFQDGFAASMHWVFLIAGAIALAAFVTSLFLKERPLAAQAALAARASREESS